MTDSLSAPLDDFKPREIEILALMAQGLTNQEIGEHLFIGKETVRWYNKQIYSKLGTSRRTEAIVRAQQFGLIEPISVASEQSSSRHTLPVTTGPFIGRDADIAALRALLQKPTVRLLSLIGTGGMGKSRLSLELAQTVQSQFEHGAAFIELTTIQKSDDIPSAALRALKISLSTTQSPLDTLLDYCREKSLLLIFDNYEHILNDTKTLTQLLQTAPDVTLIVTSRERLNLRVETTYYLRPLLDDAPQLFIEAATMMHPLVSLDDIRQDDLDNLMALVGGLPLAIILAATWLDMLPIADIVHEIEQSLDFLRTEYHDVPARHRAIRATIAPTWQRLTDNEQRALMWVALMPSGFTHALFQNLTGQSLAVLQTLVTRSMVMHGHQRRYQLHPLIQQFVLDQLKTQGYEKEAYTNQLNTLLQFVETQTASLHGDNYLKVLDTLDAERANYHHALDWGFESDAFVIASQLAVALFQYWDIKAYAHKAVHYLSLALAHPLPDTIEAAATCYRSRFYYRLGEMEKGLADAERAFMLADALDDNMLRVRSLLFQSSYLAPHPAQLAVEQALTFAEAIQDPRLLSTCWGQAGTIRIVNEDYQEALAYYQQALTASEDIGDIARISKTIYNIGLLHEKSGNIKQAIAAIERSLALKQQLGDRAGIARRLAVLGYQYMLDEDFEQAEANFNESTRLAHDTGDRIRISYTFLCQAMLAFVRTDFASAQTFLEQGLPIVRAVNHVERLTEFHHLLGIILLRRGQPEQAFHNFSQAMQLVDVRSSTYAKWLSLCGYAEMLWNQDKQDASLRLLAVLHQHPHGSVFDMRYLFAPFVYRVQQHIGEHAWATIIAEVQGVTLDDFL